MTGRIMQVIVEVSPAGTSVDITPLNLLNSSLSYESQIQKPAFFIQ